MTQIVLTVEYNEDLRRAAQNFLVGVFSDFKKASEVQPVAIEAAMNIIAGHSYYQPFNPQDAQ